MEKRKEMNRIVATKKQYVLPVVEIMCVGAYMMYGEASLPKDPFSAPARRSDAKETAPVF